MVGARIQLAIFGLATFGIEGCGSSDFNRTNRITIASSLTSFADVEDTVEQEVVEAEVAVDHCASGYQLPRQKLSKLTLYKGDRDCEVSLLSFNDGIEEFTGGPLTGAVGVSAIFKSKTSEVEVTIASTLSNPIEETDHISYVLSKPTVSNDKPSLLQLKLGGVGRIKGSASVRKVPHFHLKRFAITGVQPESKSFAVRFDFECHQELIYFLYPQRVRCDQLQLRDIRYKLVQDRYLSKPTYQTMVALFKTGSTPLDLDLDYIRPQKNFNGGFKTREGKDTLSTPKETAKNPQMLLILQSPWGFQYFNIDLRTSWTSPATH